MKTSDLTSLALVDWLRKGGLDHEWKMNATTCSTCKQKAFVFQSGKDLLFLLCARCSSTASPSTEKQEPVRPVGQLLPPSAGVPPDVAGGSVSTLAPVRKDPGEAPGPELASAGIPTAAPIETAAMRPFPVETQAENPGYYCAEVPIQAERACPQTRDVHKHPMARTGSKLDDIIGGLPQGSLILVSGLPGSGHDLFVRQTLYWAASAGAGVSYLAMDDSFERVTSEMLATGLDVEALPREAWAFIDAHRVKRAELGVTSLKTMLRSVADAAAKGSWTCIDTFSNVTDMVGEDEAMSYLDDLVECAREGRGVHFLILPDGVIGERLNQLVSHTCDGHISMELDEGEAAPIGKFRIKHMSMMNHVRRSFGYAVSSRGLEIMTSQGGPASEPRSGKQGMGRASLPSPPSGPASLIAAPGAVSVRDRSEARAQAKERGRPSRAGNVEESGSMMLSRLSRPSTEESNVSRSPPLEGPGSEDSTAPLHREEKGAGKSDGPRSGEEPTLEPAGPNFQTRYVDILMAIKHDESRNGEARFCRVYGLAEVPYRDFKLFLEDMEKKGLVRTKTALGQIQVDLTELGTNYLRRYEMGQSSKRTAVLAKAGL